MAVRGRRGRPRVSADEPSADVHLTVPSSLYDRAYRAAQHDHVTVPEWIRRAVRRNLETQNCKPSPAA